MPPARRSSKRFSEPTTPSPHSPPWRAPSPPPFTTPAPGKVHLVSDRYGLRQLCWTRRGEALAWATESKALLHLPGFSPLLDRLSLEAFLGIGYFVGNRTWLETSSGWRLPPA